MSLVELKGLERQCMCTIEWVVSMQELALGRNSVKWSWS